jgi:hypothetical protein
MQIIPTKIHGAIDYIVGIILIAAPFLLGFADGTAAQWVPILMGVATIAQSLLTRYELGVVPVIPMPVHLGIDVLVGLILAASPWMFGFADRVYLPHLFFGVLSLIVVALSQRRPAHAPHTL